MNRNKFASTDKATRPVSKGYFESLKPGDKVIANTIRVSDGLLELDRSIGYQGLEGMVLMVSQDSIAVNFGGASVDYFTKDGLQIVWPDYEYRLRIINEER